MVFVWKSGIGQRYAASRQGLTGLRPCNLTPTGISVNTAAAGRVLLVYGCITSFFLAHRMLAGRRVARRLLLT